jgi:pimeloyl-ACP methyl ester carboxylesterase
VKDTIPQGRTEIVLVRDVPTWYRVVGEGEPLLMLHPGGADSRAYDRMLAALAERFTVYLPERRGHGHTPDVPGALTFRDMADDTIAFIEQVIGRPAMVFGYSDGASVGVMVAAKRPDLVSRLLCAAGVCHYRGWHDGVIDVDAQAPSFMADAYGQVSPDGKDHYPVISRKLAEAHLSEPALGAGDLARITCRTLVMIADDDEVRIEHAVDWYQALKDGELMIMPRTSHAMIVEKPEWFQRVVGDFFGTDPIATFAPLRRISLNR